MKILPVITLITTVLAPLPSTFSQNSVSVEGKIITATSRAPIGAFTVKAYPPDSGAGTGKPLAQTLTRADGTYSLAIATTLRTVILRFEKLSYFSVPPQQTVQLTPPKTTVPDVAAVSYNYGQNVSTHDILEAFSIRQASFNAMNANLSPIERESARKATLEADIATLQKAGVDATTLTEAKKKFLAP